MSEYSKIMQIKWFGSYEIDRPHFKRIDAFLADHSNNIKQRIDVLIFMSEKGMGIPCSRKEAMDKILAEKQNKQTKTSAPTWKEEFGN